LLAKNASEKLDHLSIRGESNTLARVHVLQPSDEVTPPRVCITTEMDDENATVSRDRVHALIVAETPWASPEGEVGFLYASHPERQ
jgi:hypothetical protein